MVRVIIVLLGLCYMNFQVFALNKTLCEHDDRVPGFNPRIARMHKVYNGKSGCTATLIGKRCLLSAGHCKKYFKVLEFAVPLSGSDSSINHSADKNIYNVTEGSLQFGRSAGNDWAVFQVNKNPITGFYPGEVYGFHQISHNVQIGEEVTINGYGISRNSELCRAQKFIQGKIAKTKKSLLYYQIDTTSGDSGATIINLLGEVIGIHSHGGCNVESGYYNKGTYIGKNADLKLAIKECLK